MTGSNEHRVILCMAACIGAVTWAPVRAAAQPPNRPPAQADSGEEPRDDAPRPPGAPGEAPGRIGGPGRPGMAGPEGRPKLWPQLPQAERRQIEKFIEENFPRLFVELQRLKDTNERRYVRRMTRLAPQMRRIMETLRRDPQLGALMIRERQVEMEIWQTIAAYHQTEDAAAKARLRKQLAELAAKAFDCRHQRRELEVRELEARLSMLQTRLSEADKARDALIERRVIELLERPPPAMIEEEPDEKDGSDD